jgi:hypothetical protein
VKIEKNPTRIIFSDEGYKRLNGVALIYKPDQYCLVVEGLHDSGFITGTVEVSIFELLEQVPIEDLKRAIEAKKLQNKLEDS